MSAVSCVMGMTWGRTDVGDFFVADFFVFFFRRFAFFFHFFALAFFLCFAFEWFFFRGEDLQVGQSGRAMRSAGGQ